jgi:hypothetical protein
MLVAVGLFVGPKIGGESFGLGRLELRKGFQPSTPSPTIIAVPISGRDFKNCAA